MSGGADSTAMAVIFHIISSRMDLQLYALHIDHGLRPESGEDAVFTRNLCNSLQIPCAAKKIDVSHIAKTRQCGIEEAARIARYQALEEFKLQTNSDFICMGHHLGDLCEDVIMRLLRGAGWPSLGGMRAREGSLIRPLLLFDPASLREFLVKLGISWREDESNKNLAFLRNRIRHLVLPLLRAENPSLGHSIANIHALAALDEDFWEEVLSGALEENPWLEDIEDGGMIITLPAALLSGLHSSARLRLYHKVVRRFRQYAARGQSRTETLIKLDHALTAGQTGKTFQLPGGICAVVQGKSIVITASIEPDDANHGH